MKSLIFVSILILNVLYAYSATEPVIKIYLNDGSSKQYKINDIDNLNFINISIYSIIRFNCHQSLINDFIISTIDTIKFKTYNGRKVLTLYMLGNSLSYFLSEVDSICFFEIIYGEMADIENNQYKNIKISEQEWMAENLRVSHYRNGDSIPEVKDSFQWANLKTGAWCYFKNSDSLGKIYGKLYNWYAVNDPRGLAPEGWHIPSSTEWVELGTCLGGFEVAGGKLKSTGTIEDSNGLWFSPNTAATNESGFSGLPGGYRIYDGIYGMMSYNGYWWSTTEFEYDASKAWSNYLFYTYTYIYGHISKKDWGCSVRCIKDK